MAKHSRVSPAMTALALALAVAVAPRVSASGFQLRDQSGSGQGNAYAGISAGGSDISSMFFNPAALTRFSGNQVQFGFSEIVPTSKFSDGSASRTAVPGLGIASTPISGPTSTGNIASSATLPILYGLWSVSSDLKLGLSVNVPFGLTTDYDPSWAGRYQAIRSHLKTVDITPTLAYRMDPKWSVGVAIVARRASAELSQALDFGYKGQVALASFVSPSGQTITNPLVLGGAADGLVDVKGSAWAYGFKLGLLYEPTASLHIGMGYQSEIRETIKGTVTFTVPSSVNAGMAAVAQIPANSWAVSSGAFTNLAQTLQAETANGSASAVLNLPASISLGAIYDVNDRLSLAAEIAQTRWSTFKELRVQFTNPSAQPDSYTAENWKDAMFMALGATYRPGNAWTYRVGVAKDNTPVPDANRTPRIPDADRTWLSAGLGYQFTKAFSLDAGYSHLFVKNSTVNLQGGDDPTTQAAGQGNLSGTYKNSIDVLSIQARYKF